ncbi:proline and serine-rich protein 3 isoform X2 [Betta splendens]|uniref:Proline and serine-rich protein 3 isoform X2 n=1 Tax=Betta splendens TaxID=158456 RepID=A0A6P7KTA7_BETSP|nr:proline and serine-rich protein 3 isoform X2 [Betta splendens]
MQSSGPVFTKQNPFQPASKVGKSHYHPSSNQPLTKKKKKTALSPVRLNRRPTPNGPTVKPMGKQPCETHESHVATTAAQPDYVEVWPSSASSSMTSSDPEMPKQPAAAGKFSVSFELGGQEDSVLAKYIERFRTGRPQGRDERQVMTLTDGEEELPFWWMSPSSLPPSSTPTKATDEDDHGSATFSPAVQRQPLSPCRGSLNMSAFGEFDDTDILHLQERASKLLLRGESTLSDGSAPVSSDGLGCSDFSSPVTVDEPVKSTVIPSIIQSFTVRTDSDPLRATTTTKFDSSSLVTRTRPGEDILFQWRLRRKMEQARERSQSARHTSLHDPTFSWQDPSLTNSLATGQDYKQQSTSAEIPQKAANPNITFPRPEFKEASESFPPLSNPPVCPNIVSGFSVLQPQTIAHVPAHMHLLCDVLPCPVQSSHASVQQRIPQTSDESRAQVIYKKTPFHSEPTLEHVSSSPPASSGAEGEWSSHHRKQEQNKKERKQTRESERRDKAPSASTRKQKKSSRSFVENEHSDRCSSTNSSSHQRLPKKVIPRTEPHQQQGAQEFPRESCARDCALPPSPVHSALGQVVSEVLFSTVDSSAAQRRQVVSLAAPPGTTSVQSQSVAPPCRARDSVEVISQLLQEAEDSDGKEFEDDALLQVLRKQRSWVKKQISDMDSILNELLDEQQIT